MYGDSHDRWRDLLSSPTTKDNPEILKGNGDGEDGSGEKKQGKPKDDRLFQLEDKGDFSSLPTTSRAPLLESKDNKTSKADDGLTSTYPMDGLWETTWNSCEGTTMTFEIRQHKFKLLDYPCELKIDNTGTIQWQVGITSIDTPDPPIFQTKSKEWNTSIEWTSLDPAFGVFTWKRLDFTSSKSVSSLDRKSGQLSLECRNATEQERVAKRKKQEAFWMAASTPGKAWNLVEAAISLQTTDIKTIAQDDIIFLAERLLVTQMDFNNRKIPSHVDIAYHHTSSENLRTIQTDGLLSRFECSQRHITSSRQHGSAYGDGIYCSAHPTKHARSSYGDTTILLARMKGIEHDHGLFGSIDYPNVFNTLHVPSKGICVLQSCSQCIPIFQFPSNLLKESNNVDFLPKLSEFHKKVQLVLDKIFNKRLPPPVDHSLVYVPRMF